MILPRPDWNYRYDVHGLLSMRSSAGLFDTSFLFEFPLQLALDSAEVLGIPKRGVSRNSAIFRCTEFRTSLIFGSGKCHFDWIFLFNFI
jgi:hypothetical protein